ncbi:MAG: hypothetical protein IPM21_05680 [Acidobacteria bacterium]|nr:hypothetical protein [Acidobacteriota bacterium]
MKRNFTILLILSFALAAFASAQFPVRVPSIDRAKSQPARPTTPQMSSERNAESTATPTSSAARQTTTNRQMVMDDGFTFFDAEPAKGRNPKNTGDIDVGWFLKPSLRLIGTFPENSGFRLVIKKGGKELGKFFCGGWVYKKADDIQLRARRGADEIEDFMQTKPCSNESSPIKEIGQMDVDVLFVDGATDAEKLVRQHKIDVHKLPNIKGPKGSEYPGVAEYLIQRHAEAPFGIMHAGGNYHYGGALAQKPFKYADDASRGTISIHFPITPDKRTYYKTFLRCSANGQKVNLQVDSVDLRRPSSAAYFFESALAQRNDPRFSERITFTYLNAILPLSVGNASGKFNVSGTPGKWECSLVENGEAYRNFRFEVGSDGNIAQHPEQRSGNINLYNKTYLVELEIPAGGSSIDERLLPMPTAGIFYGIPLSTTEGKAAAAKVPKKGIAYPSIPK